MKTIRIFLLVLIIIGIGLLLTQKIWVPKLVDKIIISETDLVKNQIPATFSIRERVNIEDMTKEWVNFSKTYTDSENKYTISFKELTDKEHFGSRNPTFDVLVNKKLVGETGGQKIMATSFSQDGKYFAFRTVSACGAGCFSFSVNVVDLVNRKVSYILYPIKRVDYKGDASLYEDNVASPFIESYSFDGDNLKIISYFTGVDKNDGQIYRISPRQLWSFDFSKFQTVNINGVVSKTKNLIGVFVKNLPE
jgi:hypothetical protein